jgi:hypothetical protein
MIRDMGSKRRAERRKAEREAEARRAEEVERALEEPRLRPFEKPATGTIVKPPPPTSKPK